MLTVDLEKSKKLTETGVMDADAVTACILLWDSLSYLVIEIDRAESLFSKTGKYPPNYVEKGLPEMLENYIDFMLSREVVSPNFYYFLREIISTDVVVLNSLLDRRTRE